ncbi:dimethyl sulfoxide reductase anchor subunit [Photobacterium makurazakiensis]|uniref:dimethyl sulfoxide reductase anchor subunit family protein n=1 Tax=Photobacterium makurazakiensis TaxID=2910234 RepID=UPI003D0AC730
MEELSLVFFTVLAQAAAGTALMLAVLGCHAGNHDRQQIFLPGYISVLTLLGIAGLASLTHLGQPLRAMNVIFGLFHGSPLSVEIITVSLFGAAITLLIGLKLKQHPLSTKPMIPIIGALSGMLMVYAISRVYNIQTVEAWYHVTTPLQFFTTAAVLGVGTVSLLTAFYDIESVLLRIMSVVSLILVFIVIGSHQQHIGTLENMGDVASTQFLMWLRYGLLACGGFLWLFPMLAKLKSDTGYIASGVVMILLSELAGRAYFYDLIQQRVF